MIPISTRKGAARYSEDRNHGTREGSCELRAGFRSTDPGVEVWSDHWGCKAPPRHFGYIEIHLVTTTGAACVETEYNWGC